MATPDMRSSTTLTVIVVNYNGGERFVRCIGSLFEHPSDAPVQVIVSDNASSDGTADRVARLYPAVEILRNEGNLGLCRAFNRALRAAEGRYVLSLDNDTRVLPGALDCLVRFLDAHEDAGIVGGTLLNPDLTIQRAARGQPSAWNALFGRRSFLTRVFPRNPFTKHYLMLDHGKNGHPFEVDWTSLAALMARREILESVGGLDEDYFVYWSDADLCARIRARGFKVFSVPEAQVIHDESLAGRKGRQSPKMVIDFHRGAFLHYHRNRLSGFARIPMTVVAFVGLSLRAACLIGYGYLARSAASSRRSRSEPT